MVLIADTITLTPISPLPYYCELLGKCARKNPPVVLAAENKLGGADHQPGAINNANSSSKSLKYATKSPINSNKPNFRTD
jgi:hypothetical protein